MPERVVIVGGGDGGLMVANRLVRFMEREVRQGKLEIVVISEGDTHLYQPGLLYVALGEAVPESFQRPQKRLVLPGVKLVIDRAAGIDAKEQAVHGEQGRYGYDYLVIATGSHPDLDALPGFRAGAHSFYTMEEALRLRKTLQDFQGGRILITVGVPHKCPVAVLEFTLMLDHQLRRRGIRERSEIRYTYPIAHLHSLQPVAEWAERVFAERGIQGDIFFNPESIDPEKKQVETLEGETAGYDLLVAIPPHRGAGVILDSRLGDAEGWLPTERQTLRLKGYENVFVVGDATDLPISKAGSTAHYESEVVARNLQRLLRGEPVSPDYKGRVFCFIEAGDQEATYISFDYVHPPQPSRANELVHWFKAAYNEMYWLSLRGLM